MLVGLIVEYFIIIVFGIIIFIQRCTINHKNTIIHKYEHLFNISKDSDTIKIDNE